MKVKFLGGAEEVGRLAIKFQDDSTRFMVDYGVVPEKPPQYPMPYEPVDGIFITHAHLDHIGALPVCYHGDKASLYTTTMTANSMEPLLNDSMIILVTLSSFSFMILKTSAASTGVSDQTS